MLIENTLDYMQKYIGKPDDEYDVKTVLVKDVGEETCSDFGGHNNCTLIGNLNVLKKLSASGEIDMDDESLYKLIHAEAKRLGYSYEKKRGLMVILNSMLTKRIIMRLGLKKKVKSPYFPPKSQVCRWIDEDIPVIFSIAFGYYANHTVTVRGYETLTNKRTGKKYTFLILSDGWSRRTRYLRYKGFKLFWICRATIIK